MVRGRAHLDAVRALPAFVTVSSRQLAPLTPSRRSALRSADRGRSPPAGGGKRQEMEKIQRPGSERIAADRWSRMVAVSRHGAPPELGMARSPGDAYTHCR